MRATALLKRQHRRVEEIFDKLDDGDGAASVLLESLANDLAAHMAIEQDIFYPALRTFDPELVEESYEEHANAELALKRLLSVGAGDPTFDAKVAALKDLILRHVELEEEDLFPEIEETFDAAELDQLGEEMGIAFEKALERGHQYLLPKGLAASGDRARGEVESSLDASPRRQSGRPPARAIE